ncbi:MAG: sodium-dependent transporter [Oscillospiraceae bacterium]|nr:sodium-dependent transporter [Oscillospiraceae bacterium]
MIMSAKDNREFFGSRLGFILVSAGCAIGIGNVWKFPYVTGVNGGGVFVLFYLLFLVILGIPVLTMELAVGRASRRSAVAGFRALEKPGHKWHIHGWFAIAGCYILMMFYTSVSGWMLDYFVKFLTGTFDNIPVEEVGAVFGSMLENPMEDGVYMAITVIAGFIVCSFGLRGGLERITKIMILGLLGLIIILAVHSLTLPGALEGLSFYLLPDFPRAMQSGLGNVVGAAMNQAFFTLSLGIGAMHIFGSYMSSERTLTTEATIITALDTFVAIMSGLIIFPACFSYNVQPDKGPSLLFVTLPKVFINMPGGRIWGTLFFLFMTFASFSTIIAVFENIITASIDNFGWERKKSSTINGIIVLITSIPCVLGYNIWSNVRFLGRFDILDFEDFLVESILLPFGTLIYVLFCCTRLGWGFDNYLDEANTGKGLRLSVRMRPYLAYVLPIIIFIIIVQSLLPLFIVN